MKVAGFGFRQSATLDSLRNALAACDIADVVAIATPIDKVHNEAFASLAADLSLPVITIEAEAMQAVKTATQSSKVLEKRQTGSVAEACALVAAGPNAILLKSRNVSDDRLATCAIAQGDPT
ncbi:cobalamin biosynthesis protein [Shimia sp.]|uniref:cobalamin biosynthesis protein n=1 Tax=Shimia sp. TaxID=1954381 RepID=UPI003B8D908B